MFWLNEKFEVWWNGKKKQIPKDALEKYLAEQTTKNATGSVYVNISDKATYSDVCHFMLCNLKNAVRIQIYNDGAVRIFLYDIFDKTAACWDTPEVYTSLYNLYRLDQFTQFVEKYK